MEQALFIQVATLLLMCDQQNAGYRHTFGIFNPGNVSVFPYWPIGVPTDGDLDLSVQDIVDAIEEKYPGYPAEKAVVYLYLEPGHDDDETLAFDVFTEEDIRNMQEMEKKLLN